MDQLSTFPKNQDQVKSAEYLMNLDRARTSIISESCGLKVSIFQGWIIRKAGNYRRWLVQINTERDTFIIEGWFGTWITRPWKIDLSAKIAKVQWHLRPLTNNITALQNTSLTLWPNRVKMGNTYWSPLVTPLLSNWDKRVKGQIRGSALTCPQA